jgi:hypothetical protein
MIVFLHWPRLSQTTHHDISSPLALGKEREMKSIDQQPNTHIERRRERKSWVRAFALDVGH